MMGWVSGATEAWGSGVECGWFNTAEAVVIVWSVPGKDACACPGFWILGVIR